jgi:valyl-tRNA synthetase
MGEKRTKMSKSKGNVITIDEVVRGVHELSGDYELRDLHGRLVDWRKMCVWRSPEGYRTSSPTGKQPIFLHLKDEPVPGLISGRMQHKEARNYWAALLEKYEFTPPVAQQKKFVPPIVRLENS